MIDDFQADDFEADDFMPDEITPQNQPSFFDKASGLTDYFKQQTFPGGLVSKGVEAMQQGANKIGEAGAEGLARNSYSPYLATGIASGALQKLGRQESGYDPRIAAGLGTAAAMAPDIITSAATPIVEAPFASKAAIPMAERALGFKTPELKTVFGRGQAARAAKTALEEGIIPGSGRPQTMLNRANELANKTGQKLGQLRESVGKTPVDDILGELEALRAKATQGRTGGAWDAIHNRIDQAKKTIQGLVKKPIGPPINPQEISEAKKVGLNDIVQAKNELNKTVNWLNDLATQEGAKKISGSISRGVKSLFRKMGGNVPEYESLAKKYESAQSMKGALNKELAREQGRNLFSLPSYGVAVGELAAGNPMRAAAELGGAELLKRQGAGIAASSLNAAANQAPNMTAKILNALPSKKKEWTPEKEKRLQELRKKLKSGTIGN